MSTSAYKYFNYSFVLPITSTSISALLVTVLISSTVTLPKHFMCFYITVHLLRLDIFLTNYNIVKIDICKHFPCYSNIFFCVY